MSPVRIGHGNGHNEQTLVQYVAAADADSFGCDEAHELRTDLETLYRRRVTGVGEAWAEKRRRAENTLIVTDNDRENLGELSLLVADRLPNQLRTAPDRPLIASLYEHPVATKIGKRGVAHFELHVHAGPAQLDNDRPSDADTPVVRETIQAYTFTRQFMRAARYAGFLLVLTGDLQVRRTLDAPWSPERMIANPLGLRCWTTTYEGKPHIDWLMADDLLKLDGEPAQHRLHDHTGFVADLVPSAKVLRDG